MTSKNIAPKIVLSTINARYIHASLGLRYLLANMGELKPSTRLLEFTLDQRPDDIVEHLLATQPTIIGFGVYIWNCIETLEVIRTIKLIEPNIIIIVGGPEISFETTTQELYKISDHVITGQADLAFAQTCQSIVQNEPPAKLHSALPFDLDSLASPYAEYTEDDLANRVLYVEASRGCPFKCEFCLSSLDKTATAFDLDRFLTEMQQLLNRGARHFKFVDRTFNLKIESSRRILEFFLEAMEKSQHDLFLHFELIPDRLPEMLKELLPKFPEGSLQFEIGIQSFNVEVQQRISRKQQHERTCNNLIWLRENTNAHIHADLIFGLPGETIKSFGEGFDQLVSLGPQEVQVGILKRLRGTPITRHTEQFDMRYANTPPYRILSNADVSFAQVQRIVRFARYWDLIGNSGRFPNALPILLSDQPFKRFLAISDWIYNETGQTHKISLSKLFGLLHRAFIEELDIDHLDATNALQADFAHNKLKGIPSFLRNPMTENSKRSSGQIAQRQQRFVSTH